MAIKEKDMPGTNIAMKKTNLHSTNQMSMLGLRGKLLIGFGAITVLFLIAIGVTLNIVTATKNNATEVLSIELPMHDALFNLGAQISATQDSLRSMLLTRDDKYRTEFNYTWNYINETTTKINELSSQLANTNLNNKWSAVKSSLTQLHNEQIKLFNTNALPDSTNISGILKSTDVIINNIFNELDGHKNDVNIRSGGMYDIQYNQLHKGAEKIIHDMNVIQVTEYCLTLLAIIISSLIAIFTSRGILKNINVFRQHSSQVAAGDLTQHITLETRDELGQLGKDLNVMTDGLATITKQITGACQNMVTTLEEVKHAVNLQSTGATQQASSINEITSSLDEIEKSSSQTMQKAKALGDAAERTREKGQQGLEAVEQSVQGMKAVRDKVQVIAQTILDLSNQTQQVGEITAVVNALAQQSKMLALNASIEAAKAGEAGKGFAVVASEVKALAEQSEQSTTQVQKILESIRHAAEKAVMVTEEGTKGVDYGTSLVEQTGEIVRNLRDVIHETTIASQQIEAAVRQESIGIEQITAGMNEINQVTTTFVESTQQTNEAINHLSTITKGLKKHVDIYKI